MHISHYNWLKEEEAFFYLVLLFIICYMNHLLHHSINTLYWCIYQSIISNLIDTKISNKKYEKKKLRNYRRFYTFSNENLMNFLIRTTFTVVDVNRTLLVFNLLHSYTIFFSRGTLFFRKLYMKNFKIKTKTIKSLMEEKIPSGTK